MPVVFCLCFTNHLVFLFRGACITPCLEQLFSEIYSCSYTGAIFENRQWMCKVHKMIKLALLVKKKNKIK